MNKTLSEKIIKRNEKDANIVVAKIFFITFLLFTVVFLLNVLGVFVIYQPAMILAYVSNSVLLLSPMLINKLVPTSSKYLKYEIYRITVKQRPLCKLSIKVIFLSFYEQKLGNHILNHSGSPFNNFKKSDFNNRYHFISVNQIRKVNNHHIYNDNMQFNVPPFLKKSIQMRSISFIVFQFIDNSRLNVVK